jgi:hypothetical protein
MPKLLSHMSKLFLATALCGVALDARAEEPAAEPQPIAELDPATSDVLLAQAVEVEGPDTTIATGGDPVYVDTAERRTLPNRPLLGTSALTFTAAYLPAVITAAVNDDDTSDNLFIPIAGPWMEIARDENSPGNKALLAISGTFQGLGALGLVGSLFIPESRTSNWYLMGNRKVNVTPVATRDTYMLGAHGRF